jgi:AI-2 transport protein TqsA
VIDNQGGRVALMLCAAVLTGAALYFAESVFAPVAVSLFAIAVVWPVQKRLERWLPQLIALAITLSVTMLILAAFIGLSAWGFGKVGRWLVVNAAQIQALYTQVTGWLESHDIYVLGLFVERFDVMWLARPFTGLAQRARDLVGFYLLVIVFMMLGLLEVRAFKTKLESIEGTDTGLRMSNAGNQIALKFRRYAVIRTIASILTGLMVGGLCWFIGVDNADAWGVLAFVLNFIPFIGPFVATALPTIFAVAQFQSLETAIIIFAGVSVIQFLIGSYLEPQLSGDALAISPFLVVFSVFFGAFLWGIPGAFIGVPFAIALLTICEQYPSSQWIARLLSGSSKT